MASIQLQIFRSGGQVRRETFDTAPLGFGRDADNQIVFAESFVSRKHGLFQQNQDQWFIENLSDNGTLLNGKRVRKPVPLNPGDVISIGDQDIFHVEAILGQSSQKPVAPPPSLTQNTPAKPAPSAAAKKTRLWLTLAGVWIVILGLLVFVGPLFKGNKSRSNQFQTTELSPQSISQAVRRKPPAIAGNVPPNERSMNEALAQAREITARLDASLDAPFRAYRAYQRALAYSGQNILPDSLDARQFNELEQQLTQGVSSRYYDAYAKLRSGNFRAAEAAFRELTQYFPEPDNPLIKNVEAHRREMTSSLRRRR